MFCFQEACLIGYDRCFAGELQKFDLGRIEEFGVNGRQIRGGFNLFNNLCRLL